MKYWWSFQKVLRTDCSTRCGIKTMIFSVGTCAIRKLLCVYVCYWYKLILIHFIGHSCRHPRVVLMESFDEIHKTFSISLTNRLRIFSEHRFWLIGIFCIWYESLHSRSVFSLTKNDSSEIKMKNYIIENNAHCQNWISWWIVPRTKSFFDGVFDSYT